MKILTFVKMVALGAVATGGITSAVVFSNVNTLATPYLKVLTKDSYLKIKASQQNMNDGSLYIDYGSLPSSGINFSDLLQRKNLGDMNAFILTVGSQAYSETNLILNGVSKTFGSFNPYECDSSALMLKLYDLFYNDASPNHDLVKDFNMNFFNFVDILNTQEVWEAQNLLQYRKKALGVPPPSNGTDIGNHPGVSNVWEVQIPDTAEKENRPVVKSSSGDSNNVQFNFEPSANYYEFLPNGDYDTKYEKVYFRNQKEVVFYNSTLDWASSYASTYLTDVSFNKQGGIIAAKKEDGVWSFKTFTSASTLDDFIKFYNKDYEQDSNQNGDGSGSGDNNQDGSTDSSGQY